MKKTAKISKAIVVSLFAVALLNACSDGLGPNRQQAGAGGPVGTQGVPEVDQFVATVYNGQDANQNSIGILFPHCSNCHSRSGTGQTPLFADSASSKAYQVAFIESDSNGLKLFDLSTLEAAGSSAVVAKVASGHNCWSGSNDVACQDDAVELTDRIKDWYNAINGSGTGTGGPTDPPVELSLAESLVAPTGVVADAEPTAFKSFPDTAGVEFDGLHTILKARCQNCHVNTADTPQTPYFADDDRAVAYAALKDNQKIDINVPDNSRIYLRLKNDQHNCWTLCADNALSVLTAIENFTNVIPTPASIPVEWVNSRALTLGQGQVVSGGVRYEPDVIARYTFDDNSNAAEDEIITVAKDSSGKLPALDLSFNDSSKVSWVSGWGVQFQPGGRVLAGSATASRKLYDLIIPNSEYSIETWVVPGNVSQGADAPAVIMAYSGGGTSRNLTLGQQIYNYTLATRLNSANADLDADGVDELISTPDAAEVLQATLQHVVVNYHPSNGRNVYVNGELVHNDPTPPGILDEWNEGYILSLGADSDGSNQFLGRLRFLAIHNKAMPADKVMQNFEAGVGQKFNLLFKIGHLDDSVAAGNRMHDQSYILFTIEEFDDYSYKLFDPRFVLLGADDPATGSILTESNGAVALKGMRIGVNGKEPEVGQTFGKLDTSLSWTTLTYTTDADGNNVLVPQLSNLIDEVQHDFVTGSSTTGGTVPFRASGTIIPKAIDADRDQFFLTFEDLGGTYARTDPATPTTFSNTLLTYESGPDIKDYNFSLRNFDEVYATMASITGINPVTTNSTVLDGNNNPILIKDLFGGVVREALPSVEEAVTFVSANQVAISKLTFEFCNALVNDTTARAAFFNVGGTFNFAGDVAAAFNTSTDWAGMNIVVNSLTQKVIGTGIGNQPTIDSVKDILTDDPSNVNNTVRGLYEGLVAECIPDAVNTTSCTDNTRTPKIVKSMCMAVLGSAPMLLH